MTYHIERVTPRGSRHAEGPPLSLLKLSRGPRDAAEHKRYQFRGHGGRLDGLEAMASVEDVNDELTLNAKVPKNQSNHSKGDLILPPSPPELQLVHRSALLLSCHLAILLFCHLAISC